MKVIASNCQRLLARSQGGWNW